MFFTFKMAVQSGSLKQEPEVHAFPAVLRDIYTQVEVTSRHHWAQGPGLSNEGQPLGIYSPLLYPTAHPAQEESPKPRRAGASWEEWQRCHQEGLALQGGEQPRLNSQ